MTTFYNPAKAKTIISKVDKLCSEAVEIGPPDDGYYYLESKLPQFLDDTPPIDIIQAYSIYDNDSIAIYQSAVVNRDASENMKYNDIDSESIEEILKLFATNIIYCNYNRMYGIPENFWSVMKYEDLG